MTTLVEETRCLDIFGTDVRIIAGPGGGEAVGIAETLLRSLQPLLTRFDPSSELSRMNADAAATVAVSPLLAQVVQAAAIARARSDGLVDATVLPELERAGYAASRRGGEPADLREALAAAPPRRAASAAAHSTRRAFAATSAPPSVCRPPGVRLDLGGIAKGYAADLAGAQLSGLDSWVVDCGGDMRIGGTLGVPREVSVADPFGGKDVAAFEITDAAVATSGIARRIWRTADGATAVA